MDQVCFVWLVLIKFDQGLTGHGLELTDAADDCRLRSGSTNSDQGLAGFEWGGQILYLVVLNLILFMKTPATFFHQW